MQSNVDSQLSTSRPKHIKLTLLKPTKLTLLYSNPSNPSNTSNSPYWNPSSQPYQNTSSSLYSNPSNPPRLLYSNPSSLPHLTRTHKVKCQKSRQTSGQTSGQTSKPKRQINVRHHHTLLTLSNQRSTNAQLTPFDQRHSTDARNLESSILFDCRSLVNMIGTMSTARKYDRCCLPSMLLHLSWYAPLPLPRSQIHSRRVHEHWFLWYLIRGPKDQSVLRAREK